MSDNPPLVYPRTGSESQQNNVDIILERRERVEAVAGEAASRTAGMAAEKAARLGALPSVTTIDAGVITQVIDGVTVTTSFGEGGEIIDAYGPPIDKTFITTIVGGVITTEEA